MFTVNEDLSIYATRGDIVFFDVTASDNGAAYQFLPGDVVRIKIYGKKDAENVVLQKDFPVETLSERVSIFLTEDDTKIGEVISKPTDYWYEIELNPYTNPQTIVGYDEDGAKVFKLFPEGDDIPPYVPDPEDVAVIDSDLDATSDRPVQNQAITRAFTVLEAAQDRTANNLIYTNTNINKLSDEIAVERARVDAAVSGTTADGSEVVDIRVGADGKTYGSAGTAVREQIKELSDSKMDKDDGITPKSNTKNLLLYERFKMGEYYDAADGRLVELSTSGHYPPVKVLPNTVYTNCLCQIVCIYDENMNFIESDTKVVANKKFTTPSNAAYIIVSESVVNFGTAGLYLGEYSGEYVKGERLLSMEQVDGLNDTVNSLVWKSCGKNLFNKNSETLVYGSYINAISGEIGGHDSYCYDIVKVDPESEYTASANQNGHFAFFDENGGYISGVVSASGGTFETPSNAVAMSVSIRQVYVETFQLEKGASQTSYIEYQEGLNGNKIIDESISHRKLDSDLQSMIGKDIVHVGTGYEYRSILKALKAHNGKRVTCYVHTGVYDLASEYLEEYGDDYFLDYAGYASSVDVFDRGLNLCDGVSLIGVGNVEINFRYTGDNESVKKFFAPINTTQNNTVENISLIIGDNCCRYGIHDDFADGEGTNVFKNCYFSGTSYLNTFMGCGFGKKNTYVIENCVFENAGGLNIAYHNNVNSGAKNKLIIKDCYCNGNIRGGMYGASTEISTMVVTNCKASGISCVLTDDTGVYTNRNIKLFAWNNEV